MIRYGLNPIIFLINNGGRWSLPASLKNAGLSMHPCIRTNVVIGSFAGYTIEVRDLLPCRQCATAGIVNYNNILVLH